MLPFALLLAGGTAYAGIKTYKKFLGEKESVLTKDTQKKESTFPLQATEESPPEDKICTFDLNQKADHYLSLSAAAMGLAGAGSLFFRDYPAHAALHRVCDPAGAAHP